MTVGIDGGYVKAQGAEQGWFEVIAGKSILAFRRGEEQPNPSIKCFAFVQTYDEKPKRRLFEVLQSQGLQMNQQIEFLSDGGTPSVMCSSTSVLRRIICSIGSILCDKKSPE